MSRSSSVRSTNSCCLSMARICPMRRRRDASRVRPRGGRPERRSVRLSPRLPQAVAGVDARGASRRLRTCRAAIALAQVDPTVGDIAGNAALVRDPARGGRRAGAHLVAFPEMVLTGYPVEDLALRRSFVDASRRRSTAGPDAGGRRARRAAGRRRLPRPRRVGAAPRLGRPAGRPAERGRRAARRRRWSPATPSTTCPTTACSTSSATSCPATPCRSCGVHGVDVALAICEDLWQDGGPVAAARDRRGRAAAWSINGSPYERDKDDTRLELVRTPGRGGRLHARLRQHGRRPGRAGLRRRLDRRRRRRRGARPRRRSSPRAAGRRPRPARRRAPTARRASPTTVCASTA